MVKVMQDLISPMTTSHLANDSPARPENLSTAQQRHLDVVELIFQGYSQRHAYQTIYPNASAATAKSKVSRLLRVAHARAYKAKLRKWATEQAGVPSSSRSRSAPLWLHRDSNARDISQV